MVQSTVYVNPSTGKDTGTGQVTSPFKTLTRALKDAVPGMTIWLARGRYDTASGEVFPLVIPAGVTIIGNEPTKGKGIEIVGSGTYNSSTFNRQNVTLVLQSSAQLRGVSVTNPEHLGTGVWIEFTSPIVANNTFSRCMREGVFIMGTGKPLILDNQFLGNGSSGIFLVRNAKGEVRRNVCRQTGYGIAISDSAAPLVCDNTLVNNRVGIFLSRNARPVLRRNLIENNTSGGIVITGSAQPDLGSAFDPAGNIVQYNSKADIQNNTAFTLISVGNQLNPATVQGQVLLRSAQVPQPTMGPEQFSDLQGHWGAVFIQGLVQRRLISGFPDGTFKPDEALTRAQYAAIIAKSFPNLPRQPGASRGQFKDVSADFWAAAAIRKAAEIGFISGFPDGTFRPQQNLTRVQALVSVVNGLGLTGGTSNLLGFYSDRVQIPSYATAAVATATQKKLVVNYPQPNQLEPLRSISRAEVSALVYQALVTTGSAAAITSPYIVQPDLSIPSFIDINDHWAAEFIRSLANLDLISGFSDGRFKPSEALTRAQYAAMLVKVFDPPLVRPTTQFSDVPANYWAATTINKAYRAGFLSGYPDQTFHPQRQLLRLELIVSLVNGLSLPKADIDVLAVYEDKDSIPAYARGAVAAATAAGIVVSYPQPTHLEPKQEANRGEAVAMIYQALARMGRVNPIYSPYRVISAE